MTQTSSVKSFARRFLKVLALSGMVIVAAQSPYFGLNLIRGIRKDLERKKWRRFYLDLHRLRRQKRIDIFRNEDGNYQVELTKFGHEAVRQYDLDALTITRPKQWDGRWRFFSFDIPVHKKMARQALLGKLKELGFILVQRSLWAYPFECQKELMIIARAFKVEPHILYLSSDQVSGGKWLKRKFNQYNVPGLL